MQPRRLLPCLLLWSLAVTVAAQQTSPAPAPPERTRGDARRFESPSGVREACIALTRMPGAVYSVEDREAEERLCALDLHDDSVALCPKLRSPFPGPHPAFSRRGNPRYRYRTKFLWKPL